MKIELASGDRPQPGFLHCDQRMLAPTDLVCRVEACPLGR